MSTTAKVLKFQDAVTAARDVLRDTSDRSGLEILLKDLLADAPNDEKRAVVLFLWGSVLGNDGHVEAALLKFEEGEMLSERAYYQGRFQLAIAKIHRLIGGSDHLKIAVEYAEKAAASFAKFEGGELDAAKQLAPEIRREMNDPLPVGMARYAALLFRREFPLTHAVIR